MLKLLKLNVDYSTTISNNEFIATFTETTSSFQTLMNLLTGITAVKNVSYNITSSSDSLLIFEGNSPYSQLLDITLDVSSTGGTKVIWQRFGNRDSIRFNNSITDLSTIGFPSNPSNFYWVVS